MNTTLTTVLYTSKTLSDGTHPLMLRLTKNRKIKYISLHLLDIFVKAGITILIDRSDDMFLDLIADRIKRA